jgi:nitrogen fixation NifU-like protein
VTESLDDLVWRNFRNPVGKTESRAEVEALASDANWKIAQVENKLCGDSILFACNASAPKVAIKYAASGCSLCVASASVLATEIASGMSLVQFAQMISTFLQNLSGKSKVPPEALALQLLLQIKDFPVRLKCVRLAWEAAERAVGELAATEAHVLSSTNASS